MQCVQQFQGYKWIQVLEKRGSKKGTVQIKKIGMGYLE